MKTNLLGMSIGLIALFMALGSLATDEDVVNESLSQSILNSIETTELGDSATTQLEEKTELLSAMCDSLQAALTRAPSKENVDIYNSLNYKKITAKNMIAKGSNPESLANSLSIKAGELIIKKWLKAGLTKMMVTFAIKSARSLYPADKAEAMCWYCATINDACKAAKTSFPW